MEIRFPKTTTEELNNYIASRQELFKEAEPAFAAHQENIKNINKLMKSLYNSSSWRYEEREFYFSDNKDLKNAIECTKFRFYMFGIIAFICAVASIVCLWFSWAWVFAFGLTMFVTLMFAWCSYTYYSSCSKLQTKFNKSRNLCKKKLVELFGQNFDENNPNDLNLYSYFNKHSATEAERVHSELMTLEKLKKIDNLKLSHIDDNVPCFVETVNNIKYIRRALRMTDDELQYATSKKTIFDFSYIDEFFKEYIDLLK